MADSLTLEQIKAMPPNLRREAIKSLSTEQLEAMRSQSAPKEQPKSETSANLQMVIRQLPTEKLVELQRATPEQRLRILQGKTADRSLGEAALDTVVEVGEFVDKYTGAPTRSAISEIIKTPTLSGAGEAAKKFVDQFGEDPNLAPTGKDIARQIDISDKPVFSLPVIGDVSKAGMVGFGIDVLADPTNVIPVGAIAKATAKTAVKGAQATAKGAKAVIGGTQKAAELAADVIRATKVGEQALDKAQALGSSVAKIGKKGASVVGGGIENTKLALSKLFNPQIADDFSELADIAKANGIDPKILPEGVEFGENSIITRAARVQREGLLGEKLLDNFNTALEKVQGATTAKIQDIGGGITLSRVDAGSLLRDAFDRGVDKVLENANTTYNTIIKDYPGLKISEQAMKKLDSSLGGLEQFAKRRAKRGFSASQRSQGEQLLQSIESIRSNNGSFKQMVDALRDVGDVAFKNKNVLEIDPPDVQKLRNLYGDIKDALINTIRTDVKDGEAVAGALQINNSIISDLFQEKAVVSRVLGNPSIGPEKVFDALVKNGDTRKIEALKNVIDREEWKMIKGAFLESLIKRSDEGTFSFRQLKDAMRAKRDLLGAVLDPEDIQAVADLARLGDRFGVAVMSTSGTGASNIFKDVWGGIKQGVTNDAFIQSLKDRARNVQVIDTSFSIPQLPQRGVGFMLPQAAEKSGKALEFGKEASRLISIQERNQRNDKNKGK